MINITQIAELRTSLNNTFTTFDLREFSEKILALLEAAEAHIAVAEELNKHLDLAVRKAEGASEACRRRADEAEAELAALHGAAIAVAYMHHSGQVVTREECHNDEVFAVCCKVGTPLFAAPQPAPVVVLPIRAEHAEWSQATFGNVGPVGPLKHLSKEAIEAAEAPDDLSEWADMQFLLWDAQRRAGITDSQIEQAMIEKLAVNKARTWPEPKEGEPRLHVKSAKSEG